MKNFLLLLVVIALFPSFLYSQDVGGLVDKVKAKLAKVQNYQAEGRMKLDVSFIDAPPSKVVVYYKSPDKFKVKKDGGISLLPKGGISINLGSLLAGGSFDVYPRKDTTIDKQSLKVVRLIPQNDNGDVILSTLFIDEKQSLIKKAVVNTRENGAYEVDLSYGKYQDWGLPDKVVFSFNTKDYKLPKGITFEYEKGDKKKTDAAKNKKGKVEISYSSYVINKGVDDKVFEK